MYISPASGFAAANLLQACPLQAVSCKLVAMCQGTDCKPEMMLLPGVVAVKISATGGGAVGRRSEVREAEGVKIYFDPVSTASREEAGVHPT